MSLNKVRVQLLNPTTGDVLQEVDVLTSADSVTFADGQTFQQKLDGGALKGATGDTGATGEQGTRGSVWYSGNLVTGTSTTPTVFSGTGITYALLNDQYYNTDNGNVYVCTLAGAPSVAQWKYSTCLKGKDGDNVKIGNDYASGTDAKVFFKLV